MAVMPRPCLFRPLLRRFEGIVLNTVLAARPSTPIGALHKRSRRRGLRVEVLEHIQ